MTESAASPERPTTREQVETVYRTMVVKILMLEDVKPEDIDDEREDFIIELGANSIDALELIISVEERFGFEFDDEELKPELMLTLRHFVDQVCGKLDIPLE